MNENTIASWCNAIALDNSEYYVAGEFAEYLVNELEQTDDFSLFIDKDPEDISPDEKAEVVNFIREYYDGV